MFKLHHVKGDTYFIDAPTNVGVYKLNHKDCMLIDTCYEGSMTERLLSTLSHYNLNVKYISHTHAHVDHFGSDSTIKSKYACTIGAPAVEYIYIENPEFSNLLIFNASPFSNLIKGYPNGAKVDFLYGDNGFNIEEVQFSTISLKGHSQNQQGIITPDNVAFTGDAYLDINELQQVKMLYNYSVEGAMDSLKSLQNTYYSLYVPSHGMPTNTVKDTLQYNLENLEESANMLLQLLKKGTFSLDELMSILVSRYKVTQQVIQYYIAQSCVTSLLSYLENKGLIKLNFDNGVIKFSSNN